METGMIEMYENYDCLKNALSKYLHDLDVFCNVSKILKEFCYSILIFERHK